MGTASAANQDYLRSLGAVPVVYGDQLPDQLRKLLPDGADAVLDGAGGAALTLSLTLCADRSRILTLWRPATAAARWSSSDEAAGRSCVPGCRRSPGRRWPECASRWCTRPARPAATRRT
ncbi:MDR/zinc-dependent alcohol dehydrogenase-like family protein [Micromonospora radicis]|uniref:hypothetical protein n=1 Tax=Micromonospora radicis TaxID=1894971 RepID=UPI002D7738C9|nr:hypothetical protein [Micromonospora radicis]